MKVAEKILQAPIPNQLIDTVWGLVYKRLLKHFHAHFSFFIFVIQKHMLNSLDT